MADGISFINNLVTQDWFLVFGVLSTIAALTVCLMLILTILGDR